MKKILYLVLLSLVITGCQQQKEASQPNPQSPAGQMRAQETVRLAQEAVRTDPKNVKAWIELGNIQMDMSRFNEAIDAYQKALELDPKNLDVRVDMGTCYKNSGKPDIALKEYKKALEINPAHPNGHLNMAVVLAFDMHDKVQAIKEFERYLELVPNAPNAGQVREEIRKLKTSP
jgi:cytochrome c-type biogenesis protein CcmH/NrfG